MNVCSSKYKIYKLAYIFRRITHELYTWVAAGQSEDCPTGVFPDSGQQHQSYIGVRGDIVLIPITPPSILLSFLTYHHFYLFLPHSHPSPSLFKAAIAFSICHWSAAYDCQSHQVTLPHSQTSLPL